MAVCCMARGQNYSIKRLMAEHGLSNNYVVSIAQDKQGKMWIATEEGLNEFDGNEFVQYFKASDSIESSSLSGNELNCIIDDPTDSTLWIATQRSGLNKLDYTTGKITVYKPGDSDGCLISEAVTKVAPSSNGSIWIATYWNGVDLFDKATGTFKHFNHNTTDGWILDNIWTVAESSNNILYVGYFHQGLGVYDIKSKKFKQFKYSESDPESLPDNEVLSIHIDKHQNIWVGTRKGLAMLNPQSGKFTRFSSISAIGNHAVFDIKMSSDNTLWIAMELGGIAKLESPHGQFGDIKSIRCSSITDGYSDYTLSGNSVRCVSEDKFGNIWAGVWSGGVNFISKIGNLFDCYTYTPSATMVSDHPAGLNCRGVLAVLADLDNRLWIGTDGGGINIFENGLRTAVMDVENSHLPSNCVQAAFRDRKGNLWFGFFNDGISVYDFLQKKFVNILPENLKKLDVRGFCYLNDDELLIATSNGIYKADINTRKITGHYDLPQNLVRTILKDSFGNIWVGTFGGGLYILDSDMQVIKSFNTGQKFPSNTVNHIIEDSHGHIWAGTGEGMVLFPNHDKFDYQVLGRAQGLANAHIRAIAEDRDGNIWMSTNAGICCYIEKDNRIENYDSRDKLPQGSFTSAAATTMVNGAICFGSTGGLCKFSPMRVLTSETAPMAVFNRMRIFLPVSSDMAGNYTIAELNNGITLNHTENNISISLTTENFAYSELIEYACILDGVEKNYYKISDPSNVVFRNLAPGKYTLKVKTRYKNQQWADEASTLSITILPPWYLSGLAKAFYVALTALLIVAIFYTYRRRVNMKAQLKLEKQNREKQDALNEERMRFFTNIAHEIRTPLSLIVGPLEDICADTSLPQQTLQKLNVINNSSQKLLKLTNYLLDFRKTETHNKRLCVSRGLLNQVIEEVVQKFKELKRNKNVDIITEIEPDTDFNILFDRQNIVTILDNLISNALKYTESGFIKVSLAKQGDSAQIGVMDTGYGISADALPHIFDRYYQEQGTHQASGTGIGLSLVKNLVELHKGTIKATSTPGQGSNFVVRIPLNETYDEALHTDNETETAVEEMQKPDSMSNADSSDSDGKPIILIVEDNIDIQDYIKNSLSDTYKVITASNGKEGAEAAFNATPDIIVSDIMMPVMNGIDLCRTIKNDIRTSHIPVVLLTAKDSMKDKTEGYEAGADSYITKPFSGTLLKSRIANLLEKQSQITKFFSAAASSPVQSPVIDIKAKHDEYINKISKLDSEFLAKVESLIEENMESQEVNVAAISQKLCMSTSTLYRKIKALTGISSNEYIRKIKMRKAEKLLLEGRFSISEIAYKVGINSEVYFRQCFKDEFGSSPSEYLKKIKQESDL